MRTDFLQWLHINEDVDAEFTYWKNHFLISAWMAAGFAVGAGAMIALWPAGFGNPELRGFARGIWPLFVECAFWLGFLLGLLWAAAKRMGSGLAGVLPWEPRRRLTRTSALVRGCGQAAGGIGLLGVVLWMTSHCVSAFAGAEMAALLPVFGLLTRLCFGLAALGIIATVAGRHAMQDGRRAR